MKLKHFNYSIVKVNQTLSTNDLLKEMILSQKLENGFTLQAESQTKGKGQKGNIWVAEPGKNLTFSTFITPQLSTEKVFYLNIMASLVIRKTLEDLKIDAVIKWPNDVFVKHKKIAGILIENQIQGGKIKKSVLGIGLNVNQNNFPENTLATSIKKELKCEMDLDAVFKKLYYNLDFYFDLLINQHFFILKKTYLKHLYQKDAWCEYSSKKLGQFSGNIQDINENGQLVVKTIDGIKHSFDKQTIRFL